MRPYFVFRFKHPKLPNARKVIRIGWRRKRTDRFCDEYHYVEVSW
jgi:hypothetical protein